MQSMELTGKEVIDIGWTDTRYFGYYWDTQFNNPTLVIKVIKPNSQAQELVCDWATDLKVEIDYLNHVNDILAIDVNCALISNSTYSVNFDLGSNGYIKFNCNDLKLRWV